MDLPAGLELRCTGCGAASTDALTFRCPSARPGDDIDHVLEPPDPPDDWAIDDAEVHPFVRYRQATYPWRLWSALHGTDTASDRAYVVLVRTLDREIATVDGHGFAVTPLTRADLLPGVDVWVKDDTVNVSGSHKGRHLLGLALHLAVLERSGALPTPRPPLAIASCGNAALAAAVVARAAGGWPLQVFVPPAAAPSTVARLGALGADLHTCERRHGESGDPCFLRFRDAVESGSIPFATQGSENGLTIDGGATLGYELAEAHPEGWDRLFVQVGGGALATSTWVGLDRMVRAGRLVRLPELWTVQAEGGHPLLRALDAVRAESAAQATTSAEVLQRWRRQRSRAMWPWGGEPTSVAGGILDDETYDWRALLTAVLITGGDAIVADEATLEEANELGRTVTGIDVDHTGSAGLAGLLSAFRRGRVPAGSSAVVLFTGARRR